MRERSTEYLRIAAARCRRLAAATTDEEIAKKLTALAEEYEAKADAAKKLLK